MISTSAGASREAGALLENLISDEPAYEDAIIAAFSGHVKVAEGDHRHADRLAKAAAARTEAVRAAYRRLTEEVRIHGHEGSPLAAGMDVESFVSEWSENVLVYADTRLFRGVAELIQQPNLNKAFARALAQFQRFAPASTHASRRSRPPSAPGVREARPASMG